MSQPITKDPFIQYVSKHLSVFAGRPCGYLGPLDAPLVRIYGPLNWNQREYFACLPSAHAHSNIALDAITAEVQKSSEYQFDRHLSEQEFLKSGYLIDRPGIVLVTRLGQVARLASSA